MLISISGDVY